MIRPAVILLGALLALPACAPKQDIAWNDPAGPTAQQCAAYGNRSQGPRGLGAPRSRDTGYGSQEYECRRLAQAEERRRAQAERERQSDERKIKSATQSQAQSSCQEAGVNRTLCRNLAAIGSVLLP